jgi:hypothetical protein
MNGAFLVRRLRNCSEVLPFPSADTLRRSTVQERRPKWSCVAREGIGRVWRSMGVSYLALQVSDEQTVEDLAGFI